MKNTCRKIFLALALFAGAQTLASAQGTAFTYQGQLNGGAGPAAGLYDFEFALSNAPAGGSQIGGTVTNLTVGVTNGLFTTTLDFGAAFTGNSTWLAVSVRTNGIGGFIALSPLQPLAPTPYAIFADTASNLSGTVSAAQIAGGTVPNSVLPVSPNFSGAVAAGSFSGNGANVTNVNATKLQGLGSFNFWQTAGNAGTSPAGGNFMGTSDNQSLVIKVNGQQVMRFDPTTDTANVVGGYSNNVIQAGAFAAVIAGGGTAFNGIQSNSITGVGSYGFVGGGIHNTVAGQGGVIVGGGANVCGGQYGGVGSGQFNVQSGANSWIGGGSQNDIIGGGANNTIGGGSANSTAGSATSATVGGGSENAANATWSSVGGGYGNTANAQNTTIGGGNDNKAGSPYSTVAGGNGNQAAGLNSTVGGGNANTAGGNNATVPGGTGNSAGGPAATVAGGNANAASGLAATVAGGSTNTASGNNAIIGGGSGNTASATNSTVSGGFGNTAMGSGDVLGGGLFNQTTSSCATVPGGSNNIASGNFSFAAGTGAQAIYDGSFVWADAQGTPFASTTANQFSVRAKGGVVFATGGAGMTLDGLSVLTTSALAVFQLTNVVALATNNYFTGTNIFGGVVIATNGNNRFAGDGSGLTNLNFTQNLLPGFQAANGYAAVGGGQANTASTDDVVGGGFGNNAGASYSTIGGGELNNTTAIFATVGGGTGNNATDFAATVAGGSENSATVEFAAVGGGLFNSASNNYAVISGGYKNGAAGQSSTIAGGALNFVNGYGATVGGGSNNQATVSYATVPGGLNNLASGQYSLAAGDNAQATNDGTFTWSDGAGVSTKSFANNQFMARASGGVVFLTSTATSPTTYATGSAGVVLLPNATSWTTVSDRNAKKNFQPVNSAAVLAKLATLPIQQWNYKWENDSATPNIGPMAQDFKAAFYPGRDDHGISTLEFDGVELAAIQGLNQKLEQKETEIADLRQSVADLKKLVQSLAASK